MSRLTRYLDRCRREIDGTSTWYDIVITKIEDITDTFHRTFIYSLYRDIRNFTRNLSLFLRLAWSWRPWDSSYTLDVFTELLKHNARSCKVGHSVNSEKTYRRAMTAAGLLNRAYSEKRDKTLAYLYTKNPIEFIREEEEKYGVAYRTYHTDEVLHDKMYKLAYKRYAKAIEITKREAWEYLYKYIEYFYD